MHGMAKLAGEEFLSQLCLAWPLLFRPFVDTPLRSCVRLRIPSRTAFARLDEDEGQEKLTYIRNVYTSNLLPNRILLAISYPLLDLTSNKLHKYNIKVARTGRREDHMSDSGKWSTSDLKTYAFGLLSSMHRRSSLCK